MMSLARSGALRRPPPSPPRLRGIEAASGPPPSPRGYASRVDEPRSASDAALVVAIARYRQDALAEAYGRHAPAVFGLARRLLGEGFVAEEVVQEVFLHLWRNPDRFDPERGSLRSYLLALCHGRSVDLIRSEGARRRREEREARLGASARDDVQSEVVQRVGDVADLRDALASLTDDERRAIELAYFGGHTYREVAQLLGEPEGTIKSRIRSGLRRMRGTLTQAGIGGA